MTGIRAGGSDISRIMCAGDVNRVVVAGQDIWVNKYSYFNDFEQNRGSALETAYPGQFIIAGTNVSRGYPFIDSSGFLRMRDWGTSVAATDTAYAIHNVQMRTDRHRARSIVHAVSSGLAHGVIVGSNADASTFVGLQLHSTAGNRGIVSVINGTGAVRATMSSNPAAGATIELVRDRNLATGVSTYTALVNGSSTATWTDSGNEMPYGPGYRYAGAFVSGNSTSGFFGSFTSSPGLRDLRVEDI